MSVRGTADMRAGRNRSLPGARPTTPLEAWLAHHAQMLVFSLGKLYRYPLASLMTIAVIGISIALPTALYVLLANAQTASGGWDANARISVYLRELDRSQVHALLARIEPLAGVAALEYLDPEAALAEFRTLSGFGDALDALADNPLPGVVIVHPRSGLEPGALETLAERLGALEGVELAQLDVQWVRRLHAILRLIQRGVGVLGALLGIAVLLVVGNTIRLDILNRREEIEVTKLIGATDAFIRRPFLYGGLWYGLLGGLLALALVTTALGLLAAPVRALAELYGSGYRLSALGAGLGALVVAASALLGWLGSWLAVGRHLSRIEPH